MLAGGSQNLPPSHSFSFVSFALALSHSHLLPNSFLSGSHKQTVLPLPLLSSSILSRSSSHSSSVYAVKRNLSSAGGDRGDGPGNAAIVASQES